MRILFLNPVAALGGAERCLLTMFAELRRAEPAVELHLITSGDGPLLDRARELGVVAECLPMPPRMAEIGESALKERGRIRASFTLISRTILAVPAGREYVGQLRERIEQINPDLIHSNSVKSHLMTRLIRWTASPIVWHQHDFLTTRPIMARVLHHAVKNTSAVIAISDAVADDARKLFPETPVETIHNTVDVGHFSPGPGNGAMLDEKAGLPPAEAGTLRVGLVATYARWKGQDLFLTAAAGLLAERPERRVRFYIVGGPIYSTQGSQFSETELRAKAKEPGLPDDRIGFVPFQPDPADVYRSLDIVVHASTRPEPFGLTIAEAMACARPVIVSQAGGAAELFTHEHDAYAMLPGDAKSLAVAIQTLLDNEPLRKELSAAARETVIARFNSQRLGPQVLDLYRRLTRKVADDEGNDDADGDAADRAKAEESARETA